MANIGGKKRMLFSAGVALLMAFLVVPAFAATASASTAPLGGATSATQQWAYGGEAWLNGTVILSNGTYTYAAFFGWTVIFTATNTSASTVAIEAQRTLADSLNIGYCSPDCNTPAAKATLAISGLEQDVGFANFTNQATVFESGKSVPAVGIDNASSHSRGSLKESLAVTLNGPHGGTKTASASLSVAGTSSAGITFTPNPLGLVPLNLTGAAMWNSSAAFAAQGAWSVNYQWARTGFDGSSQSGSGNPNGQVNATGVVSLIGYQLGLVGLDDHEEVQAILLVIQGPFDDIDGIILIPHDYNLFGGGPHVWDGNSLGRTSFSQERLDGAVDAFHHFRISAASAQFGAQDSSGASTMGVTTALAPQASPGLPSSTVQAQPISVQAAQHESQCLSGGCSPATASAILPVLVIGLAALAIIAAVAVTQRRVYARRQTTQGLVGGDSQSLKTGLPPAGATIGRTTEFPWQEGPASLQEPPRHF